MAPYAGDGMVLAAARAGTLVRVQRVYLDGFPGAVRPTAPRSTSAGSPTPG